jgi:Uma2 family endonuclease
MEDPTHLTFEGLERLPDTDDKLELLQGELLVNGPPAPPNDLRDILRGARERMALEERRYEVARARLTEALVKALSQGHGPEVIFEVVSPYDTICAVGAKLAECIAKGVLEVWLIFPESWSAWVYYPSVKRGDAHGLRTPILPSLDVPFEQFP